MARTTLLAGALFALAAPAPGAAQGDRADAGAPAVRVRVERAPEGSMRRGVLPVPAWAVWAGASVVLLGAALGLAYRLRRRKR